MLDDANDSGPRECPGHEWVFVGAVLVKQPGRLLPGLGSEFECQWCGARTYDPSKIEV